MNRALAGGRTQVRLNADRGLRRGRLGAAYGAATEPSDRDEQLDAPGPESHALRPTPPTQGRPLQNGPGSCSRGAFHFGRSAPAENSSRKASVHVVIRHLTWTS